MTPLFYIIWKGIMVDKEEFLEDAGEFARLARSSERLPTGVQNAFKAVEFALKAYAHEKMNRRV